MGDPNWWNVAIAAIAFIVSVASILISNRNSTKQQQFEAEIRREIALENLKIVIATNVARINGIISAERLNNSNPTDLNYLIEPARLYAEVRDAYRGIEHHFDAPSREEINHKLNEVEELYSAFEGASQSGSLSHETRKALEGFYSDIPTLILQKINDKIGGQNIP